MFWQEQSGVDPSQSYTSAGFFDVMMYKTTGVKLELLTDPNMYRFFEDSIRGEVAMISNRVADANNKYLPDTYNETKPSTYIMDYDKLGLYASTMLEHLPVGKFRWAKRLKLEYLEDLARKGENLPEGMGAHLEVDLDYPEHLHELYNDYPLAPERVLINGMEKLTPNLGNKRNYKLSHEALVYYLSHGLVLKKVHRVITYETSAFLRPYVEKNIVERTEAKSKGDKFGDMFWKLANNAVYGKTFENVRNRCNVHILGAGEEKRLGKFFEQPHFVSVSVIPNSEMVVTRMGRVQVTLNKPIYLGSTILDKSKLSIYRFHYDHMLPKYGVNKLKLSFSDTDSLCYHIHTEDVYKDMLESKDEFDMSVFPKDHFLHSNHNKGVLGVMKDELKGDPMILFCSARPKCYALKYLEKGGDKVEDKRAKGVPKNVVRKQINFDHY